MLAAPNVSAQIQMPVTAPVSPTSVSPTFAASKLETGLPSIAEVQSALY
jgi:hypothetical protein